MNITRKEMEEFLLFVPALARDTILDKLDEEGAEWKKEEGAPERLMLHRGRPPQIDKLPMLVVDDGQSWLYLTEEQAQLVCEIWNEKFPKLKELEGERDELRERIKSVIGRLNRDYSSLPLAEVVIKFLLGKGEQS